MKKVFSFLSVSAVLLAYPLAAGAAQSENQDQSVQNFLNGSYHDNATLKDYPVEFGVTSPSNQSYGTAFPTFVKSTFGDYLHLPDCYTIYGDAVTEKNLTALIPDPAPGQSYIAKSVDPLFVKNTGLLSRHTFNLGKLTNAGASPAGAYESTGGEVKLDIMIAASEAKIDLGYFYITPKIKEALMDKIAEAKAALATRSGNEGSYDPFIDFYFYVSDRQKANDPIYDFSKTGRYDNDLYIAMMCAFHARLIPGFIISRDVTNSNIMTAEYGPDQDPNDEWHATNKRVEGLTSGEKMIDNIWNAEMLDHEMMKGTKITGKSFTLSYFGDDYALGQSTSFPEGTLVFPFVIRRDGSASIGVANEGGEDYIRYAAFNFADNNLQIYNEAPAGIFSNNNKQWIESYGYGKPSAMSFPYSYVGEDGTEQKVNLMAWEENIDGLPGWDNNSNDSDYCDLVMALQGVNPILCKDIILSDMTLTAIPVSKIDDQETKNEYSHVIVLSHETSPLTSEKLGIPVFKKNSEGKWTPAPVYSRIEIISAGENNATAGLIVLRKTAVDGSFNPSHWENPVATAKFKIDYKVLGRDEAAQFNGQTDGSAYSALDGEWIELVAPYDAMTTQGWSKVRTSKEIDLSNIKVNDIFNHIVADEDEDYAYMAKFIGSDGYVMTTEIDAVRTPKSHVDVELKAGNEFHEAHHYSELPEINKNGHYLSVKVAEKPDMYGNKETVTSYVIMDSNCEKELCKIEYDHATGTWTRLTALEDGYNFEYVGATSADEYNPVNLASEMSLAIPQRYQWIVLSTDSDALSSYHIKVNTTINPDLQKYLGNAVRDNDGAEFTNVYGAKEAQAPSTDNIVTFEAEVSDPKGVSYNNMTLFHVTSSWQLDIADTEGVKFNEWKQYQENVDEMANPITDGKVWLNIANDNEAKTGNVESTEYSDRLKEGGDGFEQNELSEQDGGYANNDVLSFNKQPEHTMTEYVLYAYIPDHGPKVLAGADGAEPCEEDCQKYIILEKRIVVESSTPTGIEDIAVDNGMTSNAEYYDLNGHRVSEPASMPGIYIKRIGDKAVKVYVK